MTFATIVEAPQDDGPFGAHGIGEHSLAPTIPAIADTLYNHHAFGLRWEAPPFTAEKAYRALREAAVEVGAAPGSFLPGER